MKPDFGMDEGNQVELMTSEMTHSNSSTGLKSKLNLELQLVTEFAKYPSGKDHPTNQID